MAEAIDTVVLRKAYELLSNEVRWTSGAWARDGQGRHCSPLSRHARRWCAWGALQKCAYDLVAKEETARAIADRISKRLVPGPGGIAFVNERGGYQLVSQVMKLGGPPPSAESTWPFPDYRSPQGFAALAAC